MHNNIHIGKTAIHFKKCLRWYILCYVFLPQFFLKNKEILTHATIWMDFEDIMLNEISQTQKDKYCMSPLL